MSRKVYAEINLHFTWHTKGSLPVIKPEIENRLHHYLKHRALETKGVIFHEVGGTENPIHLVVSIQPTLPISEWLGKLKGASSYYINHEVSNRKLLEWQDA